MPSYLSEQVLGGCNELMVDDPVWQQAVLVAGNAGCDGMQPRQHAAISQRLVAVVGGHAPREPTCKANQDGLPQLHLCTDQDAR